MARGNAGRGRTTGSRNRVTKAALTLIEGGESPVEFGLRVMRDQTKPDDLRLHAAKLAAPYLHQRPAPAGEKVTFDLPEIDTPASIQAASAVLLSAVARGELSVAAGRDITSMLETHRRNIELVEIEARLTVLENLQGDRR